MPSIKQNSDLLQQLITNGQIKPAGSPPPTSASAPIQPQFPQSPSIFIRGPLPANMVLEPDTERTFANIAMPQTRVSPNPPTANPAIGASAQSQALIVSGLLSLIMPKEYKVTVSGTQTVVTWVPEAPSTALMGPKQITSTTYAEPIFNLDGTFTNSPYVVNPTLPSWSANTPYSQNQLIVDSNSNVQRCTIGGTSQNPGPPNWATGLGQTTVDGTVTWTNIVYWLTKGDTILFASNIDPTSQSTPVTISGVADSQSNAWASFTPVMYYTNLGSRQQSLQGWYAVATANIAYGSALTITPTYVGFSGPFTAGLYWATYSQLGSYISPTVDSNFGNADSWTTPSLTIGATSVLFSISGAINTETPSAPFSFITGTSGGGNAQIAYYNPAASGSYTATWTSGSFTYGIASLSAFSYQATTTGSSAFGIPSFRQIINTDLQYAIFGASGPNHAPGAVPDPGPVAGMSRFLNENATFMVPPGTAIDVNSTLIAGSIANFNSTTPVAPSGSLNVIWSADSGTPTTNISASLPLTGTWAFDGILSSNPIFSGNPQFTGEILDGTGSAGTGGQSLTSTGTGVAWATVSSYSPANKSVQFNGVVYSDDYTFLFNAQPQTEINGVGLP